MKPRYSPWHGPLFAFFSKEFYADVARNWKGACLRYMFCLVTAAWSITVALTVALPCIAISNDRVLADLVHQMPKFTFKEARLSIDRDLPYAIKDADGNALVMFIGADDGLPATDCKAIVRVGADSFSIKVPGVEAKEIRFADFRVPVSELEFDPNSTFDDIKRILPWIPLVYFLAGLPLVLAVHVFQMFAYGGAALLIGKLFQEKITYLTGLRLAAMAMTPCIVASTVIVVGTVVFFPIRFIHLLIVYAPVHSWAAHHPFAIFSVILAIGYLMFAASAMLSRETRLAGAPPAARVRYCLLKVLDWAYLSARLFKPFLMKPRQ